MSPQPPIAIITPDSTGPPQDPPPPYPSRDRRHRRRRTIVEASSADEDVVFPGLPHADETTPLLGVAVPTRRPRAVSLSSANSVSPSLAQTVVSAFRIDLDSDAEDEGDDEATPRGAPAGDGTTPDDRLAGPPGMTRRNARGWRTRWRQYFRPMGRRVYWAALFHLLVFNFPYALLAWIYLFVFTLLGTILLVALPLGAVLCFFDLLGARTLARGEVALQSTFHGPLAHPLDGHVYPIFTRFRAPTPDEAEAGLTASHHHERSFYRNSYSMFTDPTSYQALFYFLVIKPGITILLSLLLIVLVPVALLLIAPAPAMLRLVRRLGIWQANVAIEGLYLGGG
ncbi:hypothetical protein BC834DRAFT_922582 [Gloeopeniophorella convolvens]|nr:hypothetical protein BC834DRAFT_922582 [Gloeopeniophorella convolvens]